MSSNAIGTCGSILLHLITRAVIELRFKLPLASVKHLAGNRKVFNIVFIADGRSKGLGKPPPIPSESIKTVKPPASCKPN